MVLDLCNGLVSCQARFQNKFRLLLIRIGVIEFSPPAGCLALFTGVLRINILITLIIWNIILFDAIFTE